MEVSGIGSSLDRTGCVRGFIVREDGVVRYQAPFPEEVSERPVRLVADHVGDYSSEWAAIRSVADKIGCSPETLRNWVRQSERDAGVWSGATTEELEELREVRELRPVSVRRRRCRVAPPGTGPGVLQPVATVSRLLASGRGARVQSLRGALVQPRLARPAGPAGSQAAVR